MMALEARGYFVWNPEASRPECQHEHAMHAIQEAERLAKNHPGQRFIVLKALGQAVMQQPGKFQPAEDVIIDKEIPF